MSIPREQRTSRSRPCPACGKAGWCYFLADGTAYWCGRMAGGRPWKGGWIHKLEGATPIAAPRPTPRPQKVDRSALARLARDCRLAVADRQLSALARALCPRADAIVGYAGGLIRLGTGWLTADAAAAHDTACHADGLWTFPMSAGALLGNGHTDVVGIRVRSHAGKKYSVTGSDGSALFLPSGLPRRSQLVLPEGPTSCAALLAAGFAAVGRPNNRLGAEHLRRLCRDLRPSRLVVLGDNDEKADGRWPGLEGAEEVATALAGAAARVDVVLPPPGVKDARDWLVRDGPAGFRDGLVEAIEAAAMATA